MVLFAPCLALPYIVSGPEQVRFWLVFPGWGQHLGLAFQFHVLVRPALQRGSSNGSGCNYVTGGDMHIRST